MGLCSNCKWPIQIKGYLSCGKTEEYIYPPAGYGCKDNFEESTGDFDRRMAASAKELGYKKTHTEKSEFHGGEIEITYYEKIK